MKQGTQPLAIVSRIPVILSLLVGACFGLLLRLFASLSISHQGRGLAATQVMTLAFVALGPFAIGYITIDGAERLRPGRIVDWIFLPWGAVLLSAAMTALCLLEGWICIVFAIPILLVFSTLGGVSAGIIARWKRKRTVVPTLCVALLPFLLAPIEMQLDSPSLQREVETQITIRASDATVWRNIEKVRPISPSELPPTWAHTIGFPRPVEATLSYEGVGGVRHASFEHGLMFVETVTRWEPEHLLAFSIKADTANIPKTTLDEHVTIGGRYFDVLDGEYRIENLQDGYVLLHLLSHERLSTDFNEYAGLWSDAVMRTLQNSILQVIRQRCEAETGR